MRAVKLLLVEDSAVLANHLTETIADFPQIDLIKAVDSEASALIEIRKRHIDVVVLDLQLKQGSGFGVLHALGNLQQKPCVIVLTNHDSAPYEQKAISLGARYFLDKARDVQRFPDILREILSDGARAGSIH